MDIPDDFRQFFITPIFKINPESDDKNKLREELLNNILNNKL